MQQIGDGMWRASAARAGRSVCISFGVHGNERSPIDAGLALLDEFSSGARALEAGSLLLLHANPKATAIPDRWSEGGVDLNRCFSEASLAKEPELYEEGRAREIVAALEAAAVEVLVDFHCTVEPGKRFAMHHPPVTDPTYREVTRLLEAETILGDPSLTFGGVSLDEWPATRGKVGICYETGWMGDPSNTGEAVHAEMVNVLRGLGLVAGDATARDEKNHIELVDRIVCAGAGFRWEDGVGENLQAVPAGTMLGRYEDGAPVTLEDDATLIFPKKKPELVQVGQPLVYLAVRR